MDNRQWVLAAHPTGEVTEPTWRENRAQVAAIAPGEILVKTSWISVDPYMRGKLNKGAGMQPGDVMQGDGVGEVLESAHPAWKPGDLAQGMGIGWQEYAVLKPDLPGAARINKVDPASAPPQATLSWLGMPGLTAYFAMLEVGCPRPGDTVVISAAAGAVGQVAGQIAKLAGCRVVGIVGSDDKRAWCEAIGFDATINYKTSTDLTLEIKHCCPAGVDVFFDGTGGRVHDAVMMNLAIGARAAIVGRVAVANSAPGDDIGLRASSRLIATRAKVQGFVVYDWWHRRDEGLQRLSAWYRAGALKFREDVAHGFDSVPHAFIRMMRGDNFGKQLIRL